MSESSLTSSIQTGNQHIFHGARHTTIGHAVFNNVGRDLNHNYYAADPLWDAIADVGASHDSELQFDRGRCLPGTRKTVLQLIRQWRVSELPVCWLSGAAGVGKSAIALTVAEECENDGLVASFFFFRSDPKRNNPSSLVLSIAHGLVVARPYLGPQTNQRIMANPRILKARLEDQYKKLILENLNHPPPSSTQQTPDLVIIDGLDECSDSAAQRRVLSVIFSTYQQPFHSPLQFLICSRPESWLRQDFSQFTELTKHIELNDSLRPRYDIELYFNQQFREIRKDPNYSQVEFSNPWPSLHDLWLLIDKADGQFIYPSTVIKFVKMEYTLPTDQLQIILDTISNPSSGSLTHHSPFDDLDMLYYIVLRANPDRDKCLLPILAAIVRGPIEGTSPEVLTAILQTSVNPTSPLFIEILLGLSHGTVAQTLHAMHSVLDVHGQRDNIRVYHASFSDFLYNSTRSGEFFIDKSKWDNFLACHFVRLLIRQFRCDSKLQTSPGEPVDLVMVLGLIQSWNGGFCFSPGNHCLSSELILELDNFYQLAISIFLAYWSVSHDIFLCMFAALLLLPPDNVNGRHFPQFIQLLFGAQNQIEENLAQKLQAMCSIFWIEGQDEDIHPRNSTLRDFFFDHSRSNSFFIDKNHHGNFFAQRSLHLLQIGEGSQNHILLRNWARICSNVDNPSEELLSELNNIHLENIINTTINPGWWLRVPMLRLHHLFSCFKTILSWLRLKADGVVPPDLTTRFEVVQKGFDIRSTKQDVKSGLHDNIITMIILSIVDWNICRFSISAFRSLAYHLNYYSWGGPDSTKIKLCSVKFCKCLRPTLNLDCVTTPVPGATDLYHVNIKAGCLQILKALVADLQSTTFVNEHQELVGHLLADSSLLTQCDPRSESLTLFRIVLDKVRQDEGYHWPIHVPKESQERLLSWLEAFPANCAREVENIKNDMMSLM